VTEPLKNYTEFQQLGLSKKVRLNHHRLNTLATYEVKEIDGEKAFGIRLNQGDHGTQVHFDFENDGVYQEGTQLLFRVCYKHSGNKSALFAVEENNSPYSKHYQQELDSSENWKTVDIAYVRKNSNGPVSVLITPGTITSPNTPPTLWVKSVEVISGKSE
jgi:hypothetical protein